MAYRARALGSRSRRSSPRSGKPATWRRAAGGCFFKVLGARDAPILTPYERDPLESRLRRKDAWSVREGADGKGPALAPRQPPTSRGRGLLAALAGQASGGGSTPALGAAAAPGTP